MIPEIWYPLTKFIVKLNLHKQLIVTYTLLKT